MTSSADNGVTMVVNPAANRGRSLAIAQSVVDAWDDPTPIRLVVPAGGPGSSVTALREAAADSASVWVCGGDGMVNLAVNVLAGSDIPLGIVPAGTGNDAAALAGIGRDPVVAARALLGAMKSGSVHRVDLGRCDGRAVIPGASGRWFLGMLYAGFDSAVNERANMLRRPRGPAKYNIAIALEMLRLRAVDLTLHLDGSEIRSPATLVAVGNGSRYGGGKIMVPNARWDDGTFDVTLVGPVSRRTLARLAPTLPRAGHIGHPAVHTFRAREVRIDAAGPIGYADGERVGPLPLSATCVPQTLSLLVPRKS